jgi:rare lipoprotein A
MLRTASAALLVLALAASGCSMFKSSSRGDDGPAAAATSAEERARAVEGTQAGAEAATRTNPAAEAQTSAPSADGVVDCGNGRSHKGTLDVPRSELEGIASYYGKQYDGRQTASGEIFDMNKFTAAHRTLRLGTKVRVTNMDNGRSLEVCVNDRGPYAKDRILDLSLAAAKELGVTLDGTAPVRIQIINKK